MKQMLKLIAITAAVFGGATIVFLKLIDWFVAFNLWLGGLLGMGYK